MDKMCSRNNQSFHNRPRQDSRKTTEFNNNNFRQNYIIFKNLNNAEDILQSN